MVLRAIPSRPEVEPRLQSERHTPKAEVGSPPRIRLPAAEGWSARQSLGRASEVRDVVPPHTGPGTSSPLGRTGPKHHARWRAVRPGQAKREADQLVAP